MEKCIYLIFVRNKKYEDKMEKIKETQDSLINCPICPGYFQEIIKIIRGKYAMVLISLVDDLSIMYGYKKIKPDKNYGTIVSKSIWDLKRSNDFVVAKSEISEREYVSLSSYLTHYTGKIIERDLTFLNKYKSVFGYKMNNRVEKRTLWSQYYSAVHSSFGATIGIQAYYMYSKGEILHRILRENIIPVKFERYYDQCLYERTMSGRFIAVLLGERNQGRYRLDCYIPDDILSKCIEEKFEIIFEGNIGDFSL